MEATWRPLGDYLETTWRLLGDTAIDDDFDDYDNYYDDDEDDDHGNLKPHGAIAIDGEEAKHGAI